MKKTFSILLILVSFHCTAQRTKWQSHPDWIHPERKVVKLVAQYDTVKAVLWVGPNHDYHGYLVQQPYTYKDSTGKILSDYKIICYMDSTKKLIFPAAQLKPSH